MSGRLAGKIALITGAGGKMGQAFARAYAAEGAKLILTSRTPTVIAPLADDLTKLGAESVALTADFTKGDDIDKLADNAWAAFGRVDTVLLSTQPPNTLLGDLLTTPPEAWREMMESIVWGPLRLMQQLAPRMMENGGGSIVTVISSTGLSPTPGHDAYGIAKGALWLLTRYMAKEWGKGGIRVNAINPGSIVTGDNEEQITELARRAGVLDRTALGRLGYTRECLGAAVHLASDEASFTSAQLINIDGGRM
ncbi:MAG: SDR family NAD(P)-dependent oxidoreductase [Hyphomonadaceae bacterium]